MLRRPRCSTLLPYTTLFRSALSRHERVNDEAHPRGLPGREARDDPAPVAGFAARETAWIDRKSTRLNSSHITISYAGFCLKKKNSPSSCRRLLTRPFYACAA